MPLTLVPTSSIILVSRCLDCQRLITIQGWRRNMLACVSRQNANLKREAAGEVCQKGRHWVLPPPSLPFALVFPLVVRPPPAFREVPSSVCPQFSYSVPLDHLRIKELPSVPHSGNVISLLEFDVRLTWSVPPVWRHIDLPCKCTILRRLPWRITHCPVLHALTTMIQGQAALHMSNSNDILGPSSNQCKSALNFYSSHNPNRILVLPHM